MFDNHHQLNPIFFQKNPNSIYHKIVEVGGIHNFLKFNGIVILSTIMRDDLIEKCTPEKYAKIINGIMPNTYTTVDGTTYNKTYSSGGSNVLATGSYEMTISKQGVVTWSSTYAQTSPSSGTADVRTGTDYWEWLSDNKSKEQLIISGSGSLFSGRLYYIDRLANKELILKSNNTSTVNGSTSSYDDTYTFTKE